ncbi:MAG: phage protein [Metamycoplasmataceae bacterium]
MDNNAYDVPHISAQLAEYLKAEFSADAQIAQGFLRDDGVKRSEGYLLGFLAGLGYGRQVIDVMVDNQQAFAEESDSMFREQGLSSFIPDI